MQTRPQSPPLTECEPKPKRMTSTERKWWNLPTRLKGISLYPISYPPVQCRSREIGAQTFSVKRTAIMLSAVSAMDTMMDSFRSFIEMFQGSDEKATEVLWKVENFSFCHLQTGEKIASPVFNLGKHSDCYFTLYPKGKTGQTVLDVHLKNSYNYKPTVLFFSIASARHTGLDAVWKTVTRKEDTTTASLLVKDNEQIRQNPDMLTSGDTLTIRCVVKGYNQEPQNILLRTRFNVKSYCYTLELKDFDDRPYMERNKPLPDMKKPNTTSKDVFRVYISFLPNIKIVEVHIVPCTITYNHFVTCKLLIVDSDGIPLSLLKNGYAFMENVKEEWISSHAFDVDFFLDNKELYLSKNTLTLMIELTDTHNICSEEVRYGPKTLDSKDSSLISGCLQSDIQLLFEDKSSCDVHLKIGSESVSVHKSILKARSTVFKAMMDHDLVEKATNTVVIPDMDMESLQHMVEFMYTDSVKGLNWSNALHLYYAADKYDISLLKKRCAEYLAENMNQSNIYEVLVLSDMHDDALLKKCARNFIFTQKSTLVNSEEWKTIESNYPNLALDVLRELYCKAVVPK